MKGSYFCVVCGSLRTVCRRSRDLFAGEVRKGFGCITERGQLKGLKFWREMSCGKVLESYVK